MAVIYDGPFAEDFINAVKNTSFPSIMDKPIKEEVLDILKQISTYKEAIKSLQIKLDNLQSSCTHDFVDVTPPLHPSEVLQCTHCSKITF